MSELKFFEHTTSKNPQNLVVFLHGYGANGENLINLANEGLGMTLIPYLNTRNLSEKNAENVIHFPAPPPAREISIIYHKSQLKLQIIEALKDSISGVMRGAIAFDDVQIITP